VPKNSPVYFPARPDDKEENDQSFTCRICKFVYDDPIVPFEELPDDWECPICGSPKSAFVRNL
ncbi:MAG: rubredoxin, partial [Oscillospiraceae bacterium]|nr:rubredoxin [Oscillospiraceae bacterium]